MTSLFFVRHAEPVHDHLEDRTRPLTEEGMEDRSEVTELMNGMDIQAFYSSPYIRSIDTIKESADSKGMEIRLDERLRERENGKSRNTIEMIRKRWADKTYHEEDGESINMVQNRNMEAVEEILRNHPGEHIVIGTHGTALSTILNYYDPSFGFEDFMRIIDIMPYVVRLDFDGLDYQGKEELLMIRKEFKGKK